MHKLDVIITVGYRVNSIRSTQLRQWATSVLREFAIRGYVLDKRRGWKPEGKKKIFVQDRLQTTVAPNLRAGKNGTRYLKVECFPSSVA